MSDFDFTHTNGINLPHLSVSTINSWLDNKYSFYQSKVLGKRFVGNAATVRGQAVEESINLWIDHGNEDVRTTSLQVFDEKISQIEPKINPISYKDVRDSIPGLAELALATYKQKFEGHHYRTQTKITARLEGVEREIIGYLDFYAHMVRDCKVTSKTPSKLKQGYVLQGALYRLATGSEVAFDFFVDNKKPSYKEIALSDEEYEFGINYLTKAAKALEELESCDDPKRVMELMSFPNLESFWNYDDKKAAAKSIGIIL